VTTTPPRFIPAPDEAVTLPVDELAIQVLRFLAENPGTETRSTIANPGYWHEYFGQSGTDQSFLEAMAEAWDWLTHHGLLAPKPGDGWNGWAFITRRGRRLLDEAQPLAILVAEGRASADLHRSIATIVRQQYLLGQYELAAFAALRQVEIRVRELSGQPNDAIGVSLMTAAFNPNGGSLADASTLAAEQEATMNLFRSAIGVFKNPSSHREVDYSDPVFASKVVQLADLLLRMLDRIDVRRAAGS
jgi:uncharacterized protein (TIGR02391 family)